MSRQATFWFSLASLLLLLVCPESVLAQYPCGPEALKAALPSNAPSYPDAMALSQVLKKNGIAVKCILLSKMDNAFEGMEGAALYRTDHGDFEALFLPRPQNFDQLNVVEQQVGNMYDYSFVGPRRPVPQLMEAGYREYFIKHQTILFILHDKPLSTTLEKLSPSH
jgi:hypothetical protein